MTPTMVKRAKELLVTELRCDGAHLLAVMIENLNDGAILSNPPTSSAIRAIVKALQSTREKKLEGALVDNIARIIHPDTWEFRDRALAPYIEKRGSIGEENWIYQITWKKGFRTPQEVDQWLRTGEPDAKDATWIVHLRFQDGLEKAQSIARAAFSNPDGEREALPGGESGE